jgi:hypothetical protein
LGWAASNGHIETIKKLAERKPELFAQADKDGYTPLHATARYGHTETVNAITKLQAELLTQDDSQSQWNVAPERPRLNESIFSNDAASHRGEASQHATSSTRSNVSGDGTPAQVRATAEAVFKLIYRQNLFLTQPEAQGILYRLNPAVARHLVQIFQTHQVPEDEVSRMRLNQHTVCLGISRTTPSGGRLRRATPGMTFKSIKPISWD